MRPLIGITASMGLGIYSLQQEHMPAEQHRLSDSYVQAVAQAGGIPVVLPNCEDLELLKAMVDRLDGVLLSGGGDVDPVCYGQRATGRLGTVSYRRDTAELAIAKYVIEQTDKPLLGICRGIQVMNVAMGGTLYIDLPEAGKLCHSLTMYPRHMTTHTVEVAPDSRLADALGAGSVWVNSFHHEAVQDPAPCFVVTARAGDDDVIEAMELPGGRFVVGVQWHPEELRTREDSQRLFAAFVSAAKK